MKLIIIIFNSWEIKSINCEKDDLAVARSLFSQLS
jgi:hypothetical protein